MSMRWGRRVRVGTVAGLVIWTLTALAVLPAALCCQVAWTDDGRDLPPCCAGGHEGPACPLGHRDRRHASRPDRAAPSEGPDLHGCQSLEDALVAMLGTLGLTGWVSAAPALSRPRATGLACGAPRHLPSWPDGTPPEHPPRV